MSTSIKLECWAIFATGMLFGFIAFLIPKLVMDDYAGLTFIFTLFAMFALHMAMRVIDDIAHDVKEMEDGEPRS